MCVRGAGCSKRERGSVATSHCRGRGMEGNQEREGLQLKTDAGGSPITVAMLK